MLGRREIRCPVLDLEEYGLVVVPSILAMPRAHLLRLVAVEGHHDVAANLSAKVVVEWFSIFMDYLPYPLVCLVELEEVVVFPGRRRRPVEQLVEDKVAPAVLGWLVPPRRHPTRQLGRQSLFFGRAVLLADGLGIHGPRLAVYLPYGLGRDYSGGLGHAPFLGFQQRVQVT